MAFIDGSVVNIALPVLQTRLSASAAGAQWVVEAYSLALSALVLTGGTLADRMGRRRIFSPAPFSSRRPLSHARSRRASAGSSPREPCRESAERSSFRRASPCSARRSGTGSAAGP